VIVLDTSAIVALQDRKDPAHTRTRLALEADPGPVSVPVAILSEVDFMVNDRSGPEGMDRVLGSLMDGSLLLDCGDADPPRIRELLTRYADLRLGFADAAVIACAERHGGRVLTLDRRDFDVVAAEVSLTILP
jgi:uncharacterized protein